MKNRSALNLLFAANNISAVAQGITLISIPWYFSMQGKTLLFGKVYFFITMITLVWSTYAGTLIDRLNRRNIFLTVSVIGGIIMTILSVYGFLIGQVQLWMVLLALCNTIFIYNIHWSNLWALVQEMTEPENYARVTSRMEIQNQVTSAVSGAVSAILLSGTQDGQLNFFGLLIQIGIDIKPWTLYEIFALDACTYWLAVILIKQINYASLKARHFDENVLWTRLKSGFTFLWKNKPQLIFGASSYVVFICIVMTGFLIMAEYVSTFLKKDASVYANNEFYFAAGAVLSGYAIQKFFSGSKMLVGIIVLSLLASIVQFLQFEFSPVWLFYVCCFMMGFSNAGIRVLRATYQFQTLPNHMMGRVQSVFVFFVASSRLLLAFLFSQSFFHQKTNVRFTLLVFAIMCLVASVVLVVNYKSIKGHRIAHV